MCLFYIFPLKGVPLIQFSRGSVNILWDSLWMRWSMNEGEITWLIIVHVKPWSYCKLVFTPHPVLQEISLKSTMIEQSRKWFISRPKMLYSLFTSTQGLVWYDGWHLRKKTHGWYIGLSYQTNILLAGCDLSNHLDKRGGTCLIKSYSA